MTDKLGSKHISVAQNYYNLARIYQAQGKLIKSEDLFLESLKIITEKLGSSHIFVA